MGRISHLATGTTHAGGDMNWRWPAKHENHYNPWYVIGWRLVWIGPVMLSRACLTVLVGVSHMSIRVAKRMWEETA